LLSIDYSHEDFPNGMIPALERRIQFTWDELLWSALTIGRPSLYFVFRFGNASLFEALYRIGMIRTALEENGRSYTKLRTTKAFRQMDPSEKGAINYLLGLVICKLFAAKRLDAPWTLHLDVWRRRLSAQLIIANKRPDMVAQSTTTGEWHTFECKGRSTEPSDAVKRNAKRQAENLFSILGVPCSLHVAAITYYVNHELNFYCRDPVPDSGSLKLPEIDSM
jgi:hypothetical protein